MSSVKRVYTKPVLMAYGKISHLTAGGTGTATEASASGKKRP